MGGPLDELFDPLRAPGEPVPYAPVHARVLEQDATDHHAWVLAVWEDPGGPQALHRALAQRIEATLLAELSRPVAELRDRAALFEAVRLLVFPELEDVAAAVRAFGLTPVEDASPSAGWIQALAHLRHEAQVVGADVADEPSSRWEAPISHLEVAEQLERTLIERTPEESWGESPGSPLARLSTAMKQAGLGTPTADLAGLRQVEQAVVQRQPGPIRWIPPLVFQALCDLAAVAGAGVSKRPVQWALCEPPEEGGLVPPPLVRVETPDGWAHVPLGLEVLRWCVMPLQPGEQVPSLAEWVADVFR